ncbi:MAG: hypothetical protein JWO31_974 [Phycisphaerales bacterium]|nr:hypothetical protein [Phycisphaerales bacterium]
MMFFGFPSGRQLLSVLLALVAAPLFVIGFVMTVVGLARGPAPAGRGLVIAGGSTLASAAGCATSAVLFWA